MQRRKGAKKLIENLCGARRLLKKLAIFDNQGDSVTLGDGGLSRFGAAW
jgi:hypothetical protein